MPGLLPRGAAVAAAGGARQSGALVQPDHRRWRYPTGHRIGRRILAQRPGHGPFRPLRAGLRGYALTAPPRYAGWTRAGQAPGPGRVLPHFHGPDVAAAGVARHAALVGGFAAGARLQQGAAGAGEHGRRGAAVVGRGGEHRVGRGHVLDAAVAPAVGGGCLPLHDVVARAGVVARHRLLPGVAGGVVHEHGIAQREVLAEERAAVPARAVAGEGDVAVLVAIAEDGPAVGLGGVALEGTVADGAAGSAIQIERAAVAVAGVGEEARIADGDRTVAHAHAAARAGVVAAVGFSMVVGHGGAVDGDAVGRIHPEVGAAAVAASGVAGDLRAADAHLAALGIVRAGGSPVGADGAAVAELAAGVGAVALEDRVDHRQWRQQAVRRAAVPRAIVLERAVGDHQRAGGPHPHRAAATAGVVVLEGAVDHLDAVQVGAGDGAADAFALHGLRCRAVDEAQVAHRQRSVVAGHEDAVLAAAVQSDEVAAVDHRVLRRTQFARDGDGDGRAAAGEGDVAAGLHGLGEGLQRTALGRAVADHGAGGRHGHRGGGIAGRRRGPGVGGDRGVRIGGRRLRRGAGRFAARGVGRGATTSAAGRQRGERQGAGEAEQAPAMEGCVHVFFLPRVLDMGLALRRRGKAVYTIPLRGRRRDDRHRIREAL